jgi:iron(III) transport system ATP-binding protein
MAILEGGRIAQIGKPEDVYRRPKSKVVADFIGETNFLSGTVISGSSESVVVETVIGQFEGIPGDPEWTPKAGEPATLSVRPECWSFAGEPGSRNSCTGRIGDSVYLGEVAQYQFQAAGHTLKIFELNPRVSARSGEKDFTVSVSPADVIVLRS